MTHKQHYMLLPVTIYRPTPP